MILKAIALSNLPHYYTAFSRVYRRLTKKLSISNICQINPSFFKQRKRQEATEKRQDKKF